MYRIHVQINMFINKRSQKIRNVSIGDIVNINNVICKENDNQMVAYFPKLILKQELYSDNIILYDTQHNRDDNIPFNRKLIEKNYNRRVSYYNKYMTHIQKNQTTSQDDLFTKPDISKVIGIKHDLYDKLNNKSYVSTDENMIQ